MKIVLSALANAKLKYYIECINFEISGIGLVEKREGGILYVPDIFLLKQEVSGAETSLDSQAVAEFINEKILDPDFPIEKIKLWWHSHVNMGTFWSGTDVATIDRLDTEDPEENWWISIVGNKSGSRLARVDVYQPHRMFTNNIPVEVEEDLSLKEDIIKEIQEKVTVTTFQSKFPKVGAGKKEEETDTNIEDDSGVDNVQLSKHNIYIPRKDKTYKQGNNRIV